MSDKPPVQKPMPTWMNFLCGGLAGMMSICVVQPADLVKTRMQLAGPGDTNNSVLAVSKDILKHEGVKGFYTGLSAALFRQATYTTGRLGCFNALMDWHKNAYGTPSFPIKLVMGMAAGGVGAFVGTPAEVALIRMTADGKLPKEKRRNYKNVFNALGRITREEGVTTLWRGAVATCTRAMVVNGAQLGTYAQAREMLLVTLGEGITLHFVASMISGFITTVASLPVDIIKTSVLFPVASKAVASKLGVRLDHDPGIEVQYSSKGASQLTVLKSIIKNEGVLALWSGLLPTYAKIGPMTVLTFIFLEQLNGIYYKLA